MVRPGYRLNDAILVPIFPNPAGTTLKFPEGLTGFRRLISDWGMDWGRFIDIDIRPYDGAKGVAGNPVRQQRLQFAYRIDTALVDPLGNLPPSVAGNPPPSLAFRNLLRGLEFGLPNGQSVAAALGGTPLKDKDILIGQGLTRRGRLPDITHYGSVFKNNCPLWTYVLAEAMQHQVAVKLPVVENISISYPQLGPVGGRIVAEVFLGLLFSDPFSLLSRNPNWTPGGKPKFGAS